MITSDQKNLADSTLSALKWDYTGTAVRAISSLVIGIVLARLLGPEPFGLVAIAWLAIGLGNLVADFGLGSALVQGKTISEREIRYVFTIQVLMGICLTFVLAFCAPLIAQFFDQPKLVSVLRALSLVFVIQALGVTALSLLRRQLDFKRVQFATVSSYLIGFVGLGIPLALLGYEVWSLVIAQLFQTALFSTLCYLQVKHRVSPLLVSPSNGVMRFGSKVFVTNLVNYTISYTDTFFIGRMFGVVSLGLYNRAYMLVATPMTNLVVTVQRVMFSAFSRAQDRIETVQKVYLACIGFITLLILPGYGCAALVPATVIRGLFGHEWVAAIPLLVPLALAMPFHAAMAMGGPMLWSQNRVEREFIAQLLTAIVHLGVLFVTSRISLTALAWGVFGAYVFRFASVTSLSLRTVGATWIDLIRQMMGGLILLVSTGSLVVFVDHMMVSLSVSDSLRLALNVFGGAGVFLGMLLMFPNLLFSREMRWLMGRLNDRKVLPNLPFVRKISFVQGMPS